MKVHPQFRRPLGLAAAATLLLTACSENDPLNPDSLAVVDPAWAVLPANAHFNSVLAELRRATAGYHNVAAAISDGFVLVAECEDRGGEGAVGNIFANLDNLFDDVIDPSRPEGLLYEPMSNGRLRLVGIEFAIPYSLWTSPDPPTFLDATFQPEDEFGVFGLHVWIWRHNPHGLFAPSNPNVSCEASD